MQKEVIIPRLGSSDESDEVRILRWLKDPGARVKKGEGLLEVETDKVNVEIEPGVKDDVATQMKATATFTGTGVPVELVRSFGAIISVFVRTFFGA